MASSLPTSELTFRVVAPDPDADGRDGYALMVSLGRRNLLLPLPDPDGDEDDADAWSDTVDLVAHAVALYHGWLGSREQVSPPAEVPDAS